MSAVQLNRSAFLRRNFPRRVVTRVEFVNAGLIYVKTERIKMLAKLDGQRQSNVAKTDNRDLHLRYVGRIMHY
jgi:hypothetical protein